MRTRTRPPDVFDTPKRFHTNGLGPALVVSVVQDRPPSSEYSTVRDAALAPSRVSVQVMFVVPEVIDSPPLGAVTVTTGLSRPISQVSVLCSTSRRSALDGFANGSMFDHSKNIAVSLEV